MDQIFFFNFGEKKKKRTQCPIKKKWHMLELWVPLLSEGQHTQRVAGGPYNKSWKAPFNARVLSSSVLKPMFS